MSNEQSRRLVEDLMVTDVVKVSCMASAREAMGLMRRHRVKSLVVEKRHDSDAYGILTYTSILRAIVQEEGDIDLINVYDLATRPALAVPRGLEVRHAVSMMLNFDIKRLLVTSENQLVGILSMDDIVGAILEKLDD